MLSRAIGISFLLFLVICSDALALSCAAPIMSKEFERVPYVFKGYVQKITVKGESANSMTAESTAMIDILESYKADLPKRVYVSGNAYWGQPFEPGEVYLVFAAKKDGKLFIKLCDGTAPFASLDKKGLQELFSLSDEFKRGANKMGMQME